MTVFIRLLHREGDGVDKLVDDDYDDGTHGNKIYIQPRESMRCEREDGLV